MVKLKGQKMLKELPASLASINSAEYWKGYPAPVQTPKGKALFQNESVTIYENPNSMVNAWTLSDAQNWI
jgi:hypothetical protein